MHAFESNGILELMRAFVALVMLLGAARRRLTYGNETDSCLFRIKMHTAQTIILRQSRGHFFHRPQVHRGVEIARVTLGMAQSWHRQKENTRRPAHVRKDAGCRDARSGPQQRRNASGNRFNPDSSVATAMEALPNRTLYYSIFNGMSVKMYKQVLDWFELNARAHTSLASWHGHGQTRTHIQTARHRHTVQSNSRVYPSVFLMANAIYAAAIVHCLFRLLLIRIPGVCVCAMRAFVY